MDGSVVAGDVIVCRVNGTADVYVIGTVVSGTVGELSLCRMSTMVGRELALRRGYDDQVREQQVWLFDGAAAGFVKTSRIAG
jgi:hypothetical protein